MIKATVKIEIPVKRESKLVMSDFKGSLDLFLDDVHTCILNRLSDTSKFNSIKVDVQYSDIEHNQVEFEFED
jgi:hypothetical protein